MKTYYKYISLTISAAMLCSCAEMSDGTRTRVEGTSSGAAIGGILGGAIVAAFGGNTKSVLTGVAAGAGIGGVAGYAYGDNVANKKAAYKEAEETYRQNIAVLDNDISNAQNGISTLQRINNSLAQQNKHLSLERYNQLAAAADKDISILKEHANFAYQRAQSTNDQAQKNEYMYRYNTLTQQVNAMQSEINTTRNRSY